METGVKYVKVSTIKYQLFNLNVCCHISCPSNKGFARLDPGLLEMANVAETNI